jgi:2'-5' RNA ligase
VPKFELLFDHTDCWRHNHVAHLGASQSPPALLQLVGQLEAGLDAAGIPFDRRPYVPHITLLRKADCNPKIENPAVAPIRWLARDFVLVRSSLRSGGALYEQMGRWPLL